ncbi:MAG: tetratricopeptide repeat protein [Candidatus Rokubacteria bacterium]|nr:tetratricopeptide repeat protein [Candidatus Rokubacteria bacterium]
MSRRSGQSTLAGRDHRTRIRLPGVRAVAAVIPLVLALATFSAFLPTLQNGFVDWDDRVTLLENPHYRGFGWKELRWMFTSTLMGHWVPLTWMTFGLDYLAWGMNPLGYHLTSLLLHMANAVVFYYLALRLLGLAMAGGAELALHVGAGIAALFFAIHPLRVESVAWATERRDVVSGLFFLLTLLTYLKAAQAESPARGRWLAGSIGVYGLAAASKAIVMTLPLLLIILDIYPLRRMENKPRELTTSRARGVLLEKVPYFLLALFAAGMAIYAQTELASPLEKHSLPARVQIALYGLWFYVWKTLIPLGLSPLYELPVRMSVLEPRFLGSTIAVAAITGILLVMRKRWPAGLAVWVGYAIALAPVSGLTQSGPQMTADRYTYLSCLGWALLVGAGVCALVRARGKLLRVRAYIAAVVAAVGLAGLGTLTWNQVQVWHDPETLWTHALSLDPNSSIAHTNIGALLRKKGKLVEAIEHIRKALQINASNADAHMNLAGALVDQGWLDDAIGHYQQAIMLRPRFAEAHTNLGVALHTQGKLDEAIKHYRKALELKPGVAEAHSNLAVALASQSRLDDAIVHYRQALQLNPDFPEGYNNLGLALAQQGKLDEALQHYRHAIRLRPEFAPAHLNAGNALLAQGRLDDAIEHYRQALRINHGFGAARSKLEAALRLKERR